MSEEAIRQWVERAYPGYKITDIKIEGDSFDVKLVKLFPKNIKVEFTVEIG